MSLPEIAVPDAQSRFPGFVPWFATLKQSIGVMGLEILNRAQAAARTYADTGLQQSKTETDAAFTALQKLSADHLQAARDYTDKMAKDVLHITNLALDDDGTPFFSPGSISPKLYADTDGTPFFRQL